MSRKEKLTTILQAYGVQIADEMKEKVGATLTLYVFRPEIGVRISKIRNLKDEIAVGLQVSSVRIIAPMPNGAVGIEVPNEKRKILTADEVFSSWEYKNTGFTLPCAIGNTVEGDTFVADLAEMPHLLIAGATGQGKSVGLNVIISSLIRKKSPDELKLVLIDPKQVEFSVYEAIERPYLAHISGISPIATDIESAQKTLNAVIRLMEDRYTELKSAGVRNISEYNFRNPSNKMTYFVVIVDEYGDLVMQSKKKEFEIAICRIAQKARAVGIHMIISTQRPDTKIVTGNIKANFPVRIAFRTTTGTDSRVILDRTGAEKLTGKGDMLFFAGADTTRVQCAYISTEQVISFCDGINAKYADYEPTVLYAEPEKKVLKMAVPGLVGIRHDIENFYDKGMKLSLLWSTPLFVMKECGLVIEDDRAFVHDENWNLIPNPCRYILLEHDKEKALKVLDSFYDIYPPDYPNDIQSRSAKTEYIEAYEDYRGW